MEGREKIQLCDMENWMLLHLEDFGADTNEMSGTLYGLYCEPGCGGNKEFTASYAAKAMASETAVSCIITFPPLNILHATQTPPASRQKTTQNA